MWSISVRTPGPEREDVNRIIIEELVFAIGCAPPGNRSAPHRRDAVIVSRDQGLMRDIDATVVVANSGCLGLPARRVVERLSRRDGDRLSWRKPSTRMATPRRSAR